MDDLTFNPWVQLALTVIGVGIGCAVSIKVLTLLTELVS